MSHVKKLSNVMGPLVFGEIHGDSKSHRIFTSLGLYHFVSGAGTLSPFLVRSLHKLEKIVRDYMKDLSAMEIILPALSHSNLYEKTNRNELPDLFRVEKSSLVLNPTCEEVVTDYVSRANLSHKQLPFRLYQISRKFRDEKRSKLGLLRSKEFSMKDLYCFDANEEMTENTFREVTNKYHDFFKLLGVPYAAVRGEVGDIGGIKSEEFHFFSEVGEDQIILCKNCGHNENFNCSRAMSSTEHKCQHCQSTDVEVLKGIEVAHAFNLGTRYTKPFNAKYMSETNKSLLHMSSFGLGLTRILGASVECLSMEKEIRWPTAIAPYLVCIIPPKKGSKEEASQNNISEMIYQNLNGSLQGEVVLDDRTSWTVGHRLHNIKQLGFPFATVIGRNILDSPPKVEVVDVYADTVDYVHVSDVCNYILNKLLDKAEMKAEVKTFSV